MDCPFCNIVSGKTKAALVYQDELVTAFRDIHPAGPVHVLIVPNRHIASVNDLSEADEAVSGRLLSVARKVAEGEGIAETGYRLILNTGPHANQTVFHLHLHVIGGRRMQYPMG